jgi:septum site-determining protein MinC
MEMNDMPPVKLKGVGDGFWITVDPQAPEEVIKEQLTLLFQRLRHLAINARVTLDMGGATGCDELLAHLTVFLKETFSVGLVTLPPEKRSVPVERIRQRDLSKGWNHHKSDVLMLRGRVRSGQKIESRKHIVIMGNVNPGAEILAGGHVIVLGQLRGRVHAGRADDETAIVVALEFRPTHVQIGGVAAAGLDDVTDGNAEIAVVEKGRIVVQSYLESNLFDSLPWPEVM